VLCTETEDKYSVVDIQFCVLNQGRNREGILYIVMY